jgi:ferric-dicitrate binding protein FerR (iron transport regulator)
MNTQTSMNVRQSSARPVGIDLLSGELQVKSTMAGEDLFVISAAGGRVLIGAQVKCNIRCLGSTVQVTGLDGLSTLKYEDRSIALREGQRIEYGGGKLGPVVAVDTELTMAWRRRILIFDGQSLSEVIEEINRYRPGKIILANRRLAMRKVQARFSLNQLADVASLIHDAYGAKVMSLPDGIVVLS